MALATLVSHLPWSTWAGRKSGQLRYQTVFEIGNILVDVLSEDCGQFA